MERHIRNEMKRQRSGARRRIVALGIVVGVFCAIWFAPGASGTMGVKPAPGTPALNPMSRDINDYELFAANGMIFQGASDAVITGGNIGVNNPRPPGGDDALGRIQLCAGGHVTKMDTNSQVVADYLDVDANCTLGDIWQGGTPDGSATGSSHINMGASSWSKIDAHSIQKIPSFPIVTNYPATPNVVCGAGSMSLSTGNLPPGTYGDVSLVDGSTFALADGTYNFCSLKIGKNVTIKSANANGHLDGVTINVRTTLQVGNGADLGYYFDVTHNSGDMHVNVQGLDLTQNPPKCLPIELGKTPAVQFSKYEVLVGTYSAPCGRMNLGNGNQLHGHFWAGFINSDFNDDVWAMTTTTTTTPPITILPGQ